LADTDIIAMNITACHSSYCTADRFSPSD